MKKLNALFLLILLSTLSYGQNWQNVSNSLQRKIVGADTLYRFNMGAPGFWNISDAINAATSSGVTSFNSRTGAITPLVGDYSAFFPLIAGSYTNPSWIASLEWSKITSTPTTLSGYGITDGVTLNTFQTITAAKTFTGVLSSNGIRLLGASTAFLEQEAVSILPVSTRYSTFWDDSGNYAFNKTGQNSKQSKFNFNPSATRTYTFPDSSGTVALMDNLTSKVSGNPAITGATKTKITYDSKGLVTAGADLTESDIPSLAISKVTGLQDSLTAKQNAADKGQINGFASLDGSGKVPLTQINDALIGSVNYRGTYNVATNTPALPTVDTGNKGWYYVVSDTKTVFNGDSIFSGDWVISNGTAWEGLRQNRPETDPIWTAQKSQYAKLSGGNTFSGLQTITGGGKTVEIGGVSGLVRVTLDSDPSFNTFMNGVAFVAYAGLQRATLGGNGVTMFDSDGSNNVLLKAPADLTVDITVDLPSTNGTLLLDNSITGTADEIEVLSSSGAVTISLPDTINANTTGNAETADLADNSTLWNGYGNSFVSGIAGPGEGLQSIVGMTSSATSYRWSAPAVQEFLGLGSNAYTSTAYLPLTGGTLSGDLTISKTTPAIYLNDALIYNTGSLRFAKSDGSNPMIYDYTTGNLSAPGSGTFGGHVSTTSGTIYAKGSGTESAGYQLNAVTMGYDAVNSKGWITAGGAASRTTLALNSGGGNVELGGALSGTSATFSKDAAYNNGSDGNSVIFANATTPSKKVYSGFDGTLDAGFVQAIDFGTAFKSYLINPNGGNVGIGTSVPKLNTPNGTYLTIAGTSERAMLELWRNQSIGAGSIVGQIGFWGGTTPTHYGTILSSLTGTSGADLQFYVKPDGSALSSAALTIASNQAITAASDVSVTGNITAANLASDTYTPTFTAGTNVTAVSGNNFRYIRVGNRVHVMGYVSGITTTATGAADLRVSLPIPSAFSVGGLQCVGIGVCNTDNLKNATISTDSTNDEAKLNFTVVNTSASTIYIDFMYDII